MKKHCRYLLMFVLCWVMLAAPGLASDGAEPPKPATAPTFAQTNADCLVCHADPDLRAVTPAGAERRLLVPEQAFSRSVHSNMNCLLCHAPSAKAEDFAVIPHVQDRNALPSCLNCHDKRFAHVSQQLEGNGHAAKLGNAVTCVDCHNPHSMTRLDAADSYTASVSASNAVCMDCHTRQSRYLELSGRPVYTQNLAHNFMPQAEKHLATIRCIECHTPTAAFEPHRILPKEQSLRTCKTCHQENSFFVQRVSTFAHDPNGPNSMLNKGLFDDAALLRTMQEAKLDPAVQAFALHTVAPEAVKAGFAERYVPGFGQTADLDTLLERFWLAVLGLCVLHALFRVPGWLQQARQDKAHGTTDIPGAKFYPQGIRILHWTNAVLFVILLATGFSIHYPEAALSLPLECSTSTHDLAGLLLVANFAAFVLYSLLSGEIRQYVPGSGLVARMGVQLRYYLYGMFKGEAKPFPPTPQQRLNPVQQLTYVLVYCLGMFALLASGVMLLVPELAALLPFTARQLVTAHFVLAGAYLAFVIVHLYMTTTGKRPLTLIKSMLTGKQYE